MGPAQGESERAEQRRGKDMVLRKREELVSAEADGAELRIIYRVDFGRVADRVPAKQAIGARETLVRPHLPVVVSRRLAEGKRELVIGKVRERIQIQQGLHQRGNCYRVCVWPSGIDAKLGARSYGPRRLRTQPVPEGSACRPSALRRNRDTNVGRVEALPQSFVHYKEEGSVLFDWTAHRAPKLVAGKGGQAPRGGGGRAIKKVSGIERAVAEVFKR